MKNLFGINIEEGSGFAGGFENAQPYVIREASSSYIKNQKKIEAKMDELEKKWSLPSWLNYIKIISVGVGAMLLACAVMILIGFGVSPAFSNGWFIATLTVGAVLFITGAVCFIIEYRRKKTVEDSDEYKGAMAYIDDLTKKSEELLRLPEEKTSVDVFFHTYIVWDGKQKDNTAFKYLNLSLFLFEEENMLCLATNHTVYGFDKAIFKKMLQNPKKVSFSVWNKEKRHTSEEYREFKVTLDHYGTYHVRNATSLVFENSDGFEREIVIPPYEAHHFEKILGLKAVENEHISTKE